MASSEENNREAPLEPNGRGGSRKLLWLAALVVIVGAGAAYWWLHAGRESTDDAQIEGHLHTVNAKVGGTVLRVLVNDNQYVEAGTTLVEIDSRDYDVAMRRAEADLAEAEARSVADATAVPIVTATSASQLSGARATVEQQRAGIEAAEQAVRAAQSRQASARALVERARANAERAAKDLERYRALVAKEEIARQQFDAMAAENTAAHAQWDAAVAQEREAGEGVRMAQAQREESRAKLAKAEADVRGAQTAPQRVAASKAQANSASARVLEARAALAQAKLNLEYVTVRAAVSGIVSQKSVETGQIVQPGQPLLAIVPLDDLWVIANFKENQIAGMKPGQSAEIEVDAFPGQKFRGKVDSLSAATGARFSLLPPENASGNYVKVVQRVPVKIVFEKDQDSGHRLRPGLSVAPTVFIQ